MANKLTTDQSQKVAAALALLSQAAQQINSVLEECDYELESAPEFMEDIEDFCYDIVTTVEDELDKLKNDCPDRFIIAQTA